MRGLNVPSQALLIPAGTAAGISLVSGRGIITGWGLREQTNVGPAEFDLIDGQHANGMPLAPVTLDAHESDFQWFGLDGLLFQNGLFVNMLAGTIRGAIYCVLEEMVDIGGRRILFAQTESGAYQPVGAEFQMEG